MAPPSDAAVTAGEPERSPPHRGKALMQQYPLLDIHEALADTEQNLNDILYY